MRKVFKNVGQFSVQHPMSDGLALDMGDIANPSDQMNVVSCSQLYFQHHT
jgi:hypothetical protein